MKERSVSFEDVLFYIEKGELLDTLRFRNLGPDSDRGVLVVKMQNYVYLVPYQETARHYFLNSIIPSQQATQKYIGQNSGQNLGAGS